MAINSVVSGQWSVVSGKTAVDSEQWTVDSNKPRIPGGTGVRRFCWPLSTAHWSLLSRGQAAIEYAVLTAIVVAALIAMSGYTKRALSGKWRLVGDTFGYGRQYEPSVTVVQ